MALPASALTTLATVLDELNLTSDSGGAQDTRLERYIQTASAQIAAYCGRTFERADAIAEAVATFGWTKLLVNRTPIIAVTSVVVDGSTLSASDYSIDDANTGSLFRATGWPWSASRFGGIAQGPAPGQEERATVVTYSGGYVTPQQVVLGTFTPRTLPYDLEDACVQLVTSRYRAKARDVRERARSYEASGMNYGEALFPPEVMVLLQRHVRVVSA